MFSHSVLTALAWLLQMVTDQDIEGSTCLHLAVDNGHYEVAKLCLEKRKLREKKLSKSETEVIASLKKKNQNAWNAKAALYQDRIHFFF